MKSNKQITKYFLVLTGVSMLATTAFAQSISDADLKSRLDNALRTRQTKDGKSFGFPSSSEVLNATKGKSGKFTIDTGDKEENIRFEKTKASGGVIVGSGADGLVAQSNLSANGDIVVIPPVEMSMSVTVVGGTGKYCVTPAPIEKYLEMVSSASQHGCLEIGKATRILKPGRYLLTVPESSSLVTSYFSTGHDIISQRDGFLGTFIEVAADENKIVPLRKITVPKVENHTILYTLVQDIGNMYYRKQLQQFALSLQKKYTYTSEFRFQYDGGTRVVMTAKVDSSNLNNQMEHFVSVDSNTNSENRIHQGAYVYYVLPGVYKIYWTIDGQRVPPTEVYVE